MRTRCHDPRPSGVGLSGTWAGNVQATFPCATVGGGTMEVAGPVTFWLRQIQNQLFGGGTAFAAFPENITCQPGGGATLPIRFFGLVSGDTLTDAVLLFPAQGALRPTGRASGDTIEVSGPGDSGGAMTLTLSRIDPLTPSGFRTSEQYVGPYTFSADFSHRCTNVGLVTASGTATMLVGDTGRFISGSLRLTNFIIVGFATATSNGECLVRQLPAPPEEVFNSTVLGELTSGTDQTFNGFISIPDYIPISGNFTLSSFNGTGQTRGGTFQFNLSNVGPLRPPNIFTFRASETSILKGQSTTLGWIAEYTDSVTIDNGVGPRAVVGFAQVRPETSTTYTLTARGGGGESTKSVFVAVTAFPNVQLGAPPAGLVQAANRPGEDSFTLVNNGEGRSSVQLSTTSSFFRVTPTGVSLEGGATQRFTLRGLPQPAGTYSGTIDVVASGNGPAVAPIPVSMTVSETAPSGTVQAERLQAVVEVTSPPGQDATGTVSFRNTGTATLRGVAVSNVAWVIPQKEEVTIPPGQTVSVSYRIDGKRRPVEIPVGAASAVISIRYISGTGSGPMVAQDPAPPASSTVSVTLVHIAKPTVGPGIPPPLLPGEVAFFVSGLANKPNAKGDLFLGNGLTSPLQSFALFISGSTGPSTAASLPQLAANSSIELPGLMKNVIGTTVSSGTAQLRGVDASRTSIAAIQSNTSSPAGTYSTALPIFRSTAATASNGTIVLSGLLKNASAQTHLFIQEMNGSSGGSFRIDYLDAAGRVVGSRPAAAIGAFGFAELTDAAPANAVSARITNASFGSSRLSAYALVSNPATNDGWLVTDPSAGSTTETDFVVPILSAGVAAETVLHTTNRSNVTATVTMEVKGAGEKGPTRRRAVTRPGTTPPLAVEGTAVSSIASLETTAMSFPATPGFVRISGPPGAISAVARSVVTAGSASFGSGLPAVPVSMALATGASRRFTAVDDAGSTSRAGSVPGTFQTHLQLIETNNQPVTVRLTLQFAISGGSLVTSTARVSRDYSVGGGQFVYIRDLAQNVVGANRASLGDLRNMTLDVEVVSGSGRIVPFIQSIDNGSGDMLVRTE